MVADLIVILIAIGSLFGVSALLFQIIAGLSRQVFSALKEHSPAPLWGGRFIEGISLRVMGAAALAFLFLFLRDNYLKLLTDHETAGFILVLRSVLLKLTILGFLKFSIVIGLIVTLFPLLLLARLFSRSTIISRLLDYWLKYFPKSLPLAVYYLLLIIVISVATNATAVTELPHDFPWEHVGASLRRDVYNQLQELWGFLVKIFNL